MNTLNTVAIISPGDMGHVVGHVLKENGLNVITCLQNRSERTKALAASVGITDVGTMEAVVEQADIVLSILVPAQALSAAQLAADAITATNADVLYADCNAISPATVQAMGHIIIEAGGRFVDASIIGPPPRNPGSTRIYASGSHAEELAVLNNYGLTIPVLDDEIGQASAIKMCYAALTKGTTALCTELLTAAHALGVGEALDAEFQQSQAVMHKRMQGLPNMPAKSRRWVGEMEEIAKTFAEVGMTPKILEGAADMYRFVGSTSLADRNPEDPTPLPSTAEMVEALADTLSS
ncbi:MAG: DUF1932 domain-containing protein [Chloroflexota bacterium]